MRLGKFRFIFLWSSISLISLFIFSNVVLINAQPGDMPRVWSIQPDVSISSSNIYTYTVQFNQAVSGVDKTDFIVVDETAQIGAVTALSPTTYRITVTNSPSTSVPLLVLVDDDSIMNAHGIPLGGIGHANGNVVSTDSVTTPDVSTTLEDIHTVDNSTSIDANRHISDITSIPQAYGSTNAVGNPPKTRSGGIYVGSHTSIALTSTDVPVISYNDLTNSDLKIAICNDMACTNPTISTIDSTDDVGEYTSIALTTSNIPVISYFDVTNTRLKLAICNNTTCTNPSISIIDDTGDVGYFNSLALTSTNIPIISYYDGTNGDLKLAVCDDTVCTNPTISTIDSTSDVGWNSSIALTSTDIPVISYSNYSNLNLKLAVCNNIACSSPTISIVDGTGNAGHPNALALTTTDIPIISYFDATQTSLKLAVCNNATCGTPTLSTVDNTAYVGTYVSLALTSSNSPVMSYFDTTNYSLKLAVCNDTACASPFILTRDNSGYVGWFTSIAITSKDVSIISYSDVVYGNLKIDISPLTIDRGAPNTFSKLEPTINRTVSRTSTTLTWNPILNASNYEYCVSTSASTCSSWEDVGTSTTATITGLTHGSTYYWQVRATNGAGTTLANNNTSWRFTVTLAPAAFAKTAPANNAKNQSTRVTLKWAASTRATSYEYCIATSTAACTNWKSVGTKRTVTVTGLTKNKTYFWQVRAKNAGGTTLSSSTFWKFTTAR